MDDGYKSYSIFIITDKDGNEVELAAVDEFEYDRKHYVVGARIIGDEIDDSGVYIYRAKLIDDEIIAEKITDPDEYEAVTEQYIAISEP